MAKALLPLKDKWNLKGDFALPEMKSMKFYKRLEKEYEAGKFVH
jgi:hypothetical protein